MPPVTHFPSHTSYLLPIPEFQISHELESRSSKCELFDGHSTATYHYVQFRKSLYVVFLMPIESLQSFKSNIKMSLVQFRSIFVKIERQESSLLHVSMQCPQYQLPQPWALRFVTLTKTPAFPHRDGVYPYETVRQNKPSSLLKLFFFCHGILLQQKISNLSEVDTVKNKPMSFF